MWMVLDKLPANGRFHNGRALHLLEAFLVLLLLCNRMGRCVAPPTVPCIHKNADPSEMALFGSCMLLALVIAARVRCVLSVKKGVKPSSLDG